MARFERAGDLFAGVLAHPQRLETALNKLEAMVAAAVPASAVAKKRHAGGG